MHPHVLRRSALTPAARQGMSKELIQALTGHADIRSTRRYIDAAQAGGWRDP